MICELCDGDGVLPVIAMPEGKPVITGEEPCFECGGTGITHCCEGLRPQPEQREGEG